MRFRQHRKQASFNKRPSLICTLRPTAQTSARPAARRALIERRCNKPGRKANHRRIVRRRREKKPFRLEGVIVSVVGRLAALALLVAAAGGVGWADGWGYGQLWIAHHDSVLIPTYESLVLAMGLETADVEAEVSKCLRDGRERQPA